MRNSRAKGVVLWITIAGTAGVLAASVLVGGCTAATYTDMYFGSDAGADFVAPPRDAGTDVDGAGDSGAEE